MKEKIEGIHIIFNEFSRKMLIDSELNIASNNIISLRDDLRVGPISNLNSTNEIIKRKEWLSNVLGETFSKNCNKIKGKEIESPEEDEILSAVEKDLLKIDSLKGKQNKIFYLWTFKNNLDIISTARLLFKLKKINITIFILKFDDITIPNLNNVSFAPKSLAAVDSTQIHLIFKYFIQIKAEQLIKWDELWGNIEAKDSLIRIFEDNDDLKFVEENHFDEILKSFCTTKFQSPARIIAYTLVKTEFNISEWFFNWRLKKLSKMKKLETIGELKRMRDYKVKLL